MLVSDGKDTCGGAPAAAAEELASRGVDVRVHVVGFDVERDPRVRAQLERPSLARWT